MRKKIIENANKVISNSIHPFKMKSNKNKNLSKNKYFINLPLNQLKFAFLMRSGKRTKNLLKIYRNVRKCYQNFSFIFVKRRKAKNLIFVLHTVRYVGKIYVYYTTCNRAQSGCCKMLIFSVQKKSFYWDNKNVQNLKQFQEEVVIFGNWAVVRFTRFYSHRSRFVQKLNLKKFLLFLLSLSFRTNLKRWE